jgi:pimeloyl-ACP methyl ester carboxylesterase
MCDDPWTSIIALQKRYNTLKDLAVIWVHGAGCVYGPNQDYTKRMIERNLIFHGGAYKIDVLCDPSSPRAWTQTLASGARIMPGRTEFTSEVLRAVKARISTHAQVLLIGHSYGGLVASFVAQQLKDDPRASRLHVRTSGSMYTPTDFHDIVHYLFVDDVRALRYNWATPPKALDGDAVYDPRQKIFWLRNYVVPDVKSMRNPVARQKAYDKVHAAHGWVMLKLLYHEAVLYPMNERNRDDIEEMVDIAVLLSEEEYKALLENRRNTKN